MSLVATLSALLTAVVPAVVGLALGERVSPIALVGIVIALPAIALVSWQSDGAGTGTRTGVTYGLLAGLGFALLFVTLERAGTHAGAWPLVPGQGICMVLVAPFARRPFASGRPSPSSW